MLGVAAATIRRCIAGHSAPFSPHIRQPPALRIRRVRVASSAQALAAGKTIRYVRVSSQDQSAQLQTQAARLERHFHEAGFVNVQVAAGGRGLDFSAKKKAVG